MTRPRIAVVALAAALAVPTLVVAAPDGSADVRFGNEAAGSPFPPPDGHDRSFNAKDNMIPRTVTIAAGGSVGFAIEGFHQAAVYAPGTTPGDIDVLGPGPFVNDPDGLLALGPLNVPPATQTWTTPAGTFSAPGRYLILCNFAPHFEFARMYGWVIVK